MKLIQQNKRDFIEEAIRNVFSSYEPDSYCESVSLSDNITFEIRVELPISQGVINGLVYMKAMSVINLFLLTIAAGYNIDLSKVYITTEGHYTYIRFTF